MLITLPIILPLISAILVFGLGVFVFLKNRKSSINILFGLHTLVITIWLFGTFMMFLSRGDKELSIFWDRFIYMGVVFIPIFLYHFSIVFCNIKTQNKVVILGYILSFIFLILSRTNYFVADLFEYKWGVHTKAKFFHHIFLVYFCSYVFLWFYNVYRYYRKIISPLVKQQAKYVFIAFLLLFTIGPVAYLPAYGIGIYPFAYASGVIFTVILALAILKHHLFDIKVIATELLTFAIWIFLLLRTFLADTWQERLIDGSLFALVVFFGIFLIRSVLKEVRQREEIQKLSEFKTELLSIVAHQIKNPLVTIKGYASLVEDKTISGAEAIQDVFKKIKAAADKLVMLLNNLLDLHHLEEGKMHYEFQKIELNKLLKDIINGFQIVAQQRNLNLVFEPSPSELYVNGDIYKLSQVFQNLIDNATKYTEKGFVKINIKTSDVPNINTNLRTSDVQKFVLVTVSDSGRGMSQDLTKKLFQKFSRGVEDTKAYGSGLGLYISKEIIEAHQGKIWVESEGEGKGSKFFVKLPKIP